MNGKFVLVGDYPFIMDGFAACCSERSMFGAGYVEMWLLF